MNSEVPAIVLLNQAIDGVQSGWWMILLASALFASGFIFRTKRIAARIKGHHKSQVVKREPFRHTMQTLFQASRCDQSKPRTDLEDQWVNHYQWLVQFWIDEEVRHGAGLSSTDTLWRFDSVEPSATRMLADIGFPSDIGMKRRGKAYDVLGLIEPPYLAQREQLAYFGVNADHLSRTLCDRKIRWLFESKANVRRWAQRPATPLQQVFFKIMRVGLEDGATAVAAEAAMADIFNRFNGLHTSKFNDWHTFEGVYKELGRCQFGAKVQPPLPDAALLFAAFKALQAEGKTGLEQYIQPQMVLDKVDAMRAKGKNGNGHVPN